MAEASGGAPGRATGTESPSPADTLGSMPIQETPGEELTRRLTYLMLFRVVLITLVLGATTLLYWLGDADLIEASSLILYAIVGVTYSVTIAYALALQRGYDPIRLAYLQLGGDLVIASLLVHVTGGAHSAYTFFYPLAIIGAAVVRYRNGAVAIGLAAAGAFLLVSLLGWAQVLPVPPGQRLLPSELTPLQLVRQVALNLAAIAGVSVLAVNLGGQLSRTSASLESHRSAAADLLTLHRDIVRSLSSGLLTVHTDGRISTLNQAACEMLAADPASVMGKPLAAVLPELADQIHNLPADDLLRRGEIHRGVPGGEDRVLGVSVSPLYDHRNQVRGRVINFQDLTEMRRMEANVKRAERLAMVGGIAAGVAHEIRNPLASISGSVELLRDAPATDDDSRALMDIVVREIDRLNGLLTELLDYTNPRPLRPIHIDARELVEGTLRVFDQDRRFEGVAVALVDTAPPGPLQVSADPEKLRQALWNLLRNAAEAIEGDGGHIQLRLAREGDDLLIEVADDGPGIPAERRERIFDPFFTTKARGSGLGLATVSNIATDHGGDVQFREGDEGGSVFRLRLPGCGDGSAPEV